MEKDNTIQEFKKFKNGEIRAMILDMVGIAGMITLMLMAPNAIRMLKIFKVKHRRYQSPSHLREVVERMRRQKYISVKSYNGEEKVFLTDKGRYELLKFRLKERKLKTPKKWDRKWRIIIFDIEEKKRWIRDKIRQEIQIFGFHKLQQSVWIYPHECEELITLLKADCKMGKEMLYIVTSNIEGEEFLKKSFKL